MLPNICDSCGEIVYHGFYDRVVHTKLAAEPERTAFTRSYRKGQVMPQIIDHGGGRFWADEATLRYLVGNGMIVRQYCDADGTIIDDFPVNPNGSMLNIESVANIRGNIKLGMAHDERKTNALAMDDANLAFESMREYIEDGCPDLSRHAKTQDIAITPKDYSYLCPSLDPEKTYDIYIKMLTDDNERTTAQLFLGEGFDIDRRRLIRIEMNDSYNTIECAKQALERISAMDFFAGIMLKKDLPSIKGPGTRVYQYEVIGRNGGMLVRDFREYPDIVDGYPFTYESVSSPNPDAHMLKKKLFEYPALKDMIRDVQTGTVFFFPNEESRSAAMQGLFD